MELSKPTAILLDWDGTLVDSMPVIHMAFNAVRQHNNLPPLTRDEARVVSGYPRDLVHQTIQGAVDEDLWQNVNRHIYYSHFEKHKNDMPTLMPDAAATIEFLSQRGIPLGVVTNKNRQWFNPEFAALQWQHHFSATCCPDEAPHNKPHPDAALHCLSLMNIAPSENVWFIGDTAGDITCANAAGLTSVLLGHADCPSAKLRFANHTELLGTLQDVLL